MKPNGVHKIRSAIDPNKYRISIFLSKRSIRQFFFVKFRVKNPGIQNGYPQPVVIRYCCFFSSFKKHCCILNELVKRKQTRTYAGRRYRAPIQNRDVLRNFSFWYIKLSVGWNQITVILLKFLSVLARRSCTFSWQRFCWDRFVANT